MSYPFRPFTDQQPFSGGKKTKSAFVGGMAALAMTLSAAPAEAGRLAYASASFTLGFPNGHITVGPVVVSRTATHPRHVVVVEKVVSHEDEYVDEIRDYDGDCNICQHAGRDFDEDHYVVENRVIFSGEHRCRHHAKVVVVRRDEYPEYCRRQVVVVARPPVREVVVVREQPTCDREVRIVREQPRYDRNVVVVRPREERIVVVPPRRNVTVIHHDGNHREKNDRDWNRDDRHDNGHHNGWDKERKDNGDNGRHNGWDKQKKDNGDNGRHNGWDKSDKGTGNANRGGDSRGNSHSDRGYDKGKANSGGLYTAPSQRPSRERGVRIGR